MPQDVPWKTRHWWQICQNKQNESTCLFTIILCSTTINKTYYEIIQQRNLFGIGPQFTSTSLLCLSSPRTTQGNSIIICHFLCKWEVATVCSQNSSAFSQQSDISLSSWWEPHTCSLYSNASSSCAESCGGCRVLWRHGTHYHHISLPSVLPTGCHLCTADMVAPSVASWRTLQEWINKLFTRSVYLMLPKQSKSWQSVNISLVGTKYKRICSGTVLQQIVTKHKNTSWRTSWHWPTVLDHIEDMWHIWCPYCAQHSIVITLHNMAIIKTTLMFQSTYS